PRQYINGGRLDKRDRCLPRYIDPDIYYAPETLEQQRAYTAPRPESLKGEGLPIVDIDQGKGSDKDERFSCEVQRNHNRVLYLHPNVGMIEKDRKCNRMHCDDTCGRYCAQGI